MKKLLFFFCLLPVFGVAQNFHFGARLGAANYQGDLKAHSISFSGMKLFGSIGARYDLSEHLSARSYFSLTALQADDKKGTESMKARNLNFKSKIFDWELTGQYSLFSLNNKWWTPYIFAGIGLFHFKPYTEEIGGSKVFLQGLSTEGQGFTFGRDPYKLTQFCLPLGFGVDYSLNEDMRVGLELGYRKTFTDYIDDVSTTYVDQAALLAARGQQAVDLAWRGDEHNGGNYPPAGSIRGNEKYKDGYYYIALTYTLRYFFDKYKQVAGLPSGSKSKRVGCPTSRGY